MSTSSESAINLIVAQLADDEKAKVALTMKELEFAFQEFGKGLDLKALIKDPESLERLRRALHTIDFTSEGKWASTEFAKMMEPLKTDSTSDYFMSKMALVGE